MDSNFTGLEAIDFRYLLLDLYKQVGLSENELAVLLMTDHLLRQGNDLVTADLLSLKMNLKVKEIDAILAQLVKRELLSYETTKDKLRTSVEPLKKKLYKLFQLQMAKNNQNLLSADRAEILSRLYSYFEQRLNRTLSPIENQTMSKWLDDAYSEEDIKTALETAIATNKKNFKAIDRALRTSRRRDDIALEGVSGVSDSWNADIERTIEIAKTKWVNNDGE
ncbi:MAG: DnaD domain protein [Bacilli bacterium]|nr:DnaD domain protein [Bacilli bacterium]